MAASTHAAQREAGVIESVPGSVPATAQPRGGTSMGGSDTRAPRRLREPAGAACFQMVPDLVMPDGYKRSIATWFAQLRGEQQTDR